MDDEQTQRRIFVSYAIQVEENGQTSSGFGNCDVVIPRDTRITCLPDLQAVAKALKEHNGAKNIIILNWREFE